jgi:hypothetical protein
MCPKTRNVFGAHGKLCTLSSTTLAPLKSSPMHPYTPNLYTLNNNPPSNYEFFFNWKKGTKQEDERDEDLQIIV